MYACGDNSQGCLGVPGVGYSAAPRRVDALAGLPIVQVVAGDNHCLALSLSGSLYAWGRCKNGQLGLGEAVVKGRSFVDQPTKVNVGSKVKNMAAGGDHSVLIVRNGHVLCAGLNSFGQCGSDPLKGLNIWEFTRVENLPEKSRWLAVTAGKSHSVLVSAQVI